MIFFLMIMAINATGFAYEAVLISKYNETIHGKELVKMGLVTPIFMVHNSMQLKDMINYDYKNLDDCCAIGYFFIEANADTEFILLSGDKIILKNYMDRSYIKRKNS